MTELSPQDWLTLFGMGSSIAIIGGMAVSAGRQIYRSQKQAVSEFEKLKKEYRPDFNREELHDFYNRLKDVSQSFWWGKTRKKADDLIAKIESQLQPVIKKEISDSLQSSEMTAETTLDDLSETYAKTLSPRKIET